MHVNRRSFLQWAGLGAATVPLSSRLWALPTPVPARLVVLMLRGAYDGISALVPYADDFYYDSRPGIAIARPPPASGSLRAVMADGLALDDSVASVDHAIRLDGRWGLHPRLLQPLGGLVNSGQLAFVPFAGTGFESRSHFDAQDWLESGQPSSVARPDLSVGFLNRLAAELAGRKGAAVSFTNNLPVALRGPVEVANSPVYAAKPQGATMAQGFESQVLAMYQGHAWQAMAEEGTGLRRALSEAMQQEMQASSRGAQPAQGFALQAQRMGSYLRDHPKVVIAFMDVGGWDTHAAQGAANGVLSTRLQGLGQGLQNLAKGLGPSWQNTVVVVVSEFGRTFAENGSKGTDHGHGNVMWVAGGALTGKGVAGEQVDLTAKTLHQGRDLPVLNLHQEVMAGLLQRMYGLNARALGRVFPAATAKDLRLL